MVFIPTTHEQVAFVESASSFHAGRFTEEELMLAFYDRLGTKDADYVSIFGWARQSGLIKHVNGEGVPKLYGIAEHSEDEEDFGPRAVSA
jgi:hypothetical protein